MDEQALAEVVTRALKEDVGEGDITTEATVSGDQRASALIIQKGPGVVFGLDVAELVFKSFDAGMTVERLVDEGAWRESGPVLALEGRARAILTGERTALNLLGRLSGVATATARYVRAVDGSGVSILDTRKTTPGLRALEKAAVRAGGGRNHRSGLYDAILIKENHIAAAGGLTQAVRMAATAYPDLPLEVECRTLEEVREALSAGAHRILLDNMNAQQLREISQLVGSRAELEASGGVTLQTVGEIARSGVQFISVGALTHSAGALDLSLILE